MYYALTSKPAQVKVEDNKVYVSNYDIQEISNFLSSEECDTLIQLSKGRLFPSKVYSTSSDLHDTSMRQSNQCWLQDTHHPVIEKLSKKVADHTHTHNNYQEELQVVSYDKGGFFRPHYDACEGSSEFCKRLDGDNGPRLLTFLIYLNDDFEGGDTHFPHINKTIKPEKGKAVLFYNVNKDGYVIHEAFHGGNPVESGNKWIANKWVRIR